MDERSCHPYGSALRLGAWLVGIGLLGGLLVAWLCGDAGSLLVMPFGLAVGVGVVVFFVTAVAWLVTRGEAGIGGRENR